MKVMNHPHKKDLVLLGGGHSHSIFLKMWGMNPMDKVRVTLVSDGTSTPYSGMLPGLIAGDYEYEEAHIDLRQLCEFAGVRFINSKITGLDPQRKCVHLEGRPSLRFDCVSLNLGSSPDSDGIAGAEKFGVGIKPVAKFLDFWSQLQKDFKDGEIVSIVGAGAAGVETAICMKKALPNLDINLIHGSDRILPSHNKGVQKRMLRSLEAAKVKVKLNKRVRSLAEGEILCEDGETVKSHHTIFTTQAKSPVWLKDSGLDLDPNGFVYTKDTLQSLDYPYIFAVGDIASMINFPRAKSGVFAVRQGKPLFHNIRAFLKEKKIALFIPQGKFLSLLNQGNGAVLSRGPLVLSGALMGRYKDYIDRKFMARFQKLTLQEMRPSIGVVERSDEFEETIRCHGCAAKVGSHVLHKALTRLDTESWTEKEKLNIHHDDAAIIDIPAGTKFLQTIDHVSAFVSDPFVFGQIAANHCLSDIFAMGAEPHSALANIIVPYAESHIMEEDIYQVLEGVLHSFRKCGAKLIGGHTSEGRELSLGLNVNGILRNKNPLQKTGLQKGDKLILSKGLGTGLILAAAMRIRTTGRSVDTAIASMVKDNYQASKVIYQSGAHACTDVTGFGLIGHLLEMMKDSDLSAYLEFHKIPVFEGVDEILQKGINSSLYPQNKAFLEMVDFHKQLPIHRLLVDPQTSGGLLAAIPSDQADDCVKNLMAMGYEDAAIIGEVKERTGQYPVTLAS